MKVFFRWVLILTVLFIAQLSGGYSQGNYPGSAVVEQEMENLREVKAKLGQLAVKDTSDRQVIESLIIIISSSIIHVEYLGDILRSPKYSRKTQKQAQTSQDKLKTDDENECRRCCGTGQIQVRGVSLTCTSCDGDGVVWTPAAPGNAKPCGRCRGKGIAGESLVCPGCKGSGWAHSRPSPPDGWWR